MLHLPVLRAGDHRRGAGVRRPSELPRRLTNATATDSQMQGNGGFPPFFASFWLARALQRWGH